MKLFGVCHARLQEVMISVQFFEHSVKIYNHFLSNLFIKVFKFFPAFSSFLMFII